MGEGRGRERGGRGMGGLGGEGQYEERGMGEGHRARRLRWGKEGFEGGGSHWRVTFCWHSLVSAPDQSEGRRNYLTNQSETLCERNTFCYACLVISPHFISIH